MSDEYVLQKVCDERKDRANERYDDIVKMLERMESKLDKVNGTKIIWKVVGVMTAYTLIIVGSVALLLTRL